MALPIGLLFGCQNRRLRVFLVFSIFCVIFEGFGIVISGSQRVERTKFSRLAIACHEPLYTTGSIFTLGTCMHKPVFTPVMGMLWSSVSIYICMYFTRRSSCSSDVARMGQKDDGWLKNCVQFFCTVHSLQVVSPWCQCRSQSHSRSHNFY